jgi:hypothetical protein
MPKIPVDYSNTTFYKIRCNDAANTDIYIGHTTNFVQRKYLHKRWSKNETMAPTDRGLYTALREWGGWDNWHMEILSVCSCKDIDEVSLIANVYIQQYGATLNSSRRITPRLVNNEDNLRGSNSANSSFICDACSFVCSKPVDWQRHVNTRKHKTGTGIEPRGTGTQPAQHVCTGCNAQCNSRTSLWRHTRDCMADANVAPTTRPDTDSIMEILKQNQTFRELMIEQSVQLRESHRKMQETQEQMQQTQYENMELQRQLLSAVNDGKLISGNMTTNHHHNNQKFNLNFFLNTTCKDAINMSDFIQTIEVQMNELENIGRNGYVAGMTDIILSRIKDLDVSKRPVHCTDLKREIMYVRDKNEWNKDTAEKSYLRKAIAMVSKKNYGKTMEWREHNPECLEVGSPKYDFCFKMMRNVLGDFEDIQIRMDNKIIKSLAKEVAVDR